MTTRMDIEFQRHVVKDRRNDLQTAEYYVRRCEADIEMAERYLEQPWRLVADRAVVTMELRKLRETVLPRCVNRAEYALGVYEKAAAELDELRARYLEEDPSRVPYWEDEDDGGQEKRRGYVCVI